MKLTERANAGLHTHVEARIHQIAGDRTCRVLDVGAGTGAFLSRLKEGGFACLKGIDIAVPANRLEGIDFHAYDLDSGAMPFADGSFQVIVSIEVFEHIENMGALLKELARVLTHDGTILVTTPNIHSMEARLRYLLTSKLKQFDELSDPTHIYPVSLFAFERLLGRFGLKIEQRWGFPVDGSSPTSRRGLRLAARLLSALGVRSPIAGDHLCMLIRRNQESIGAAPRTKQDLVASHY